MGIKKVLAFLKNNKDYFIITGIFILATAVLYGWDWFKSPYKLQLIYQNWDGPNYVIIARSFYNPLKIIQVNYIKWLTPEYFAAHFPLYPVFIRFFSFMGYFRSMLFTSLLFSLLMLFIFYKFIKKFKLSSNPLLLTLAFIFLPPRWFIVYHVGSSEPLFMFLLLLVFYFYLSKRYLFAALIGFFLCLTRFQGLIFFAAIEIFIFLEFIRDKKKNIGKYLTKSAYFLLMPLAVILLFYFYKIQYGNFWIFFKSISEWQHLAFPPFQGFSYPKYGLATFWLEEKVYVYLIFSVAIFKLLSDKKYFLGINGLIYFLPLLFLVHMDLSRYILPIAYAPFVAFEKIITKKFFLFGLLLILPSIFAYSITFMNWNIGP